MLSYNNEPGIWLLKPTNTFLAYKGNGMTVFSNPEEYKQALFNFNKLKAKDPKASYVIQQYVDKLDLFKNKKYHLRVFMFVNGKSYSVCSLARICTARRKFIQGDYLNPDIHDTHLGSTSDEYIFNIPKDKQWDELFNSINEFITPHFKTYDDVKNPFIILGLDVLISQNQIWLLEINKTPSMEAINRSNKKYWDLIQYITEWILGCLNI